MTLVTVVFHAQQMVILLIKFYFLLLNKNNFSINNFLYKKIFRNLPRKLTLLSKCLLQQLRIFLWRPIHQLYCYPSIQCLWKQMYWIIFRLLPTHQWNLDFRSLLSMPILHWRRKRMPRMVNRLKFMRQNPQLWRLGTYF